MATTQDRYRVLSDGTVRVRTEPDAIGHSANLRVRVATGRPEEVDRIHVSLTATLCTLNGDAALPGNDGVWSRAEVFTYATRDDIRAMIDALYAALLS